MFGTEELMRLLGEILKELRGISAALAEIKERLPLPSEKKPKGKEKPPPN